MVLRIFARNAYEILCDPNVIHMRCVNTIAVQTIHAVKRSAYLTHYDY